jgi:hypothetical protein
LDADEHCVYIVCFIKLAALDKINNQNKYSVIATGDLSETSGKMNSIYHVRFSLRLRIYLAQLVVAAALAGTAAARRWRF